MGSAKEMLERVRSVEAAERVDRIAYATQLASELPAVAKLADLETRDAVLVGALQQIDELATRVMKLRLDQRDSPYLAAPTRKMFAATVANYAQDLPLLAQRVRDIVTRAGGSDADVRAVVEAARASLDLRDVLRAGVLSLVRERATATIPEADRRARDPDRGEPERKRWSAARRDLEMLVEEPARILAAPLAERLAAWPEQLDEPAAKPEPSLAELLELD